MRTSGIASILAVLCIGAGARQALANEPAPIPSYYDQLQFNLTSPTAFSTAIGGYANPAVYGTLPAEELIYSWSDEGNSFSNMGNWGLFFGAENIGFGVVRSKMQLTDRLAEVNDWRLSLSGEEHGLSVGLGFGWTSGDKDLANRSTVGQVGVAHRYSRYASLGLVGNFALNKSFQSGLIDFAVRPLGTQMLTVFADYELPKGVSVSDAPWSVGAMADIGPGLHVAGRYFEDDRFSFSIGMAFGFGPRLTGSPRFDKDGGTTNTTYEIRMGWPDHSWLEERAMRGNTYLSMDLKGNVKYRKFKYFDPESHSLAQLLTDIDYAKNDPRVAGIAMNLSGMKVSRGKAWEIRQSLEEFRDAGKKIVIYTDDLGMTQMELATVADKIVFDPEGMVFIPGYVLSRTYVRNLLDKIGIGFDEWRFLKYKSAAEAFSRTSMSDADREQRLGLIEDFYATVRSDVASSRRVTEAQFDSWVDERTIISADDAVELGIVDQLGRWDDVKDAVKELEGDGKFFVGRGYLEPNRIPDTRWDEKPTIAIVYALGMCELDKGIRARKLEKIFLALKDDPYVDAVVFRVDSPGGSALASDRAAVALKKCAEKKPVIVSQGDVAASGGYWLSMYGQQIYALPGTVTGSIGVIGGWIWNEGIGDKLGHTSDHVNVGEHSDLFAGIRLLLAGPVIPDRPMTADEREQLIDLLTVFYNSFVERAAKARGMPTDDVHRLAEGRVFSGVDAKANGLVDEIGSLVAAVRAAKAAAGIAPDEDIRLAEYPELPPFRLRWNSLPDVVARVFGDGAPKPEPELPENYAWTYLQSILERPGRPLYMLPPDLYLEEAEYGW